MSDTVGRPSSRSSTTASNGFAFDSEMDRLWANCEYLAGSTTTTYSNVDQRLPTPSSFVKPLHLALGFLFDGLRESSDPRLFTDKSELPRSLELPLFWTAISRASRRGDIVSHLHEMTNRLLDERLVQQRIGQDIWQKLQETNQRDEKRTSFGAEGILNRATVDTETILKRAKSLCDENGSDFIALHHVLLALLEHKDLQDILEKHRNLDAKRLPDIVRSLRSMSVRSHDSELFPVLNQWATDLTQLVKEKKERGDIIDPLIGRRMELRRLMSILSRRKKNSAVLLGDPGTGKTAIAEGLAQRLVEGHLKIGTTEGQDQGSTVKVPESVVARVFNLDLASLLASTACKSAYEQIVQMMLDEIAQHEERGIRAIIFMDNLSQIAIGGYRGDGTGLDAATIMKPFLMKGKLRCVGCSTVEDFRMYIEKDGALARQFSPIYLCESTPKQTMEILRGLKDALQSFHRVSILDEAIVAATTIATQFFAHKRLPDSAIDLLDETCAQANLTRSAKSETIWKLQRSRVVLEMDVRSLMREVDEESDRKVVEAKVRLSKLERKIEDSSASRRLRRVLRRKLKETDGKIKLEEDKFINGDNKAKQAAIDRVQGLGIEQEELRYKLEQAESGTCTLNVDELEKNNDPITAKMVAKSASYHTFIPAAEALTSSQMLHVLSRLGTVVIGQPEAVEAVTNTVQCMWAGLKNPRRPIASFLFGGPSGSGKTLLVKELANIALRQSGKLMSINASDYAEPHNITRLIGTPACTGFDQGGQLTECVRRKPFSVVHVKDIERACIEFRLLMQTILDEGTIRDGDGNVVDFTNCIIIISTSVGQGNVVRTTCTSDEEERKVERKHFVKEIQSSFPGEFLSRLDQMVIFRRMSGASLMAMVHARLEELRNQLSIVDLNLSIHEAALGWLEYQAALPRVGSARRLERLIRSDILEPLAKLVLKNDVPENKVVALNFDEDLRRISVRLAEGGPTPVAERMPESPTPSSPSTSYYSFETDDEGSVDVSTEDSLSVDEEEDGRHCQCQSWTPLLPAGPPVLRPLPQKIY